MRTFLLHLLMAVSMSGYSQLSVNELRVENLKDPLGLDIVTPRFSWQLQSSNRNIAQDAYEIRVIEGKKSTWASGKISSGQSVHVPYAGPALESGKLYSWRVRVWDIQGKTSAWSSPANFRMALLKAEDWKAKWIESGFEEDSIMRPAQYFRKEFQAGKKIASAIAYITSHGIYEAEINGKRVGDLYLTPGWTSYKKRIQYQVYDVTSMLKDRNAIGVSVGNGWYRGYLAWENNKNVYGDKLGVLFQLDIQYTDGSRETVISDESWKSSTGPVRYTEIYHGEIYDAGKDIKGWSQPGFDDSRWTAVKTASYPDAQLLATYNEPIKKQKTFNALKLITTPKGEKVIDFGQNLVGWVMVKGKGNKGDTIKIKHAEVLDKEGNFYIENLRAAKATATYILNGQGEEIFEPNFTFFGFRYIKIEGVEGEINPSDYTAVALHSDMPPTGQFTTSNELVNKLQHNIQWGQRGNFLDVPTDCPQRDERLGWTGDAQVFFRTAAYNFGVNNFFSKWMKDVALDQQPGGSVPFVVPNVLGPGAGASAGWADVATIIPWDAWQVYGDKRILEDQYSSMKSWVKYMRDSSTNHLWNRGFHFGDWLFYRPFDDNDGRAAVTDKYLIAQCFYANSARILANAAKVLGNTADAEEYSKLVDSIKSAFAREYMTPTGRLVSGTQTAYVLALNFDMLPEALRKQAAERLVQNIRSYGTHLTTGFLGTPYLCHVLTRFGYTDVAYDLLMQETYPSWLYPVKMGATTIWERWNGIGPDGNFAPASMNSFNHYAYGAIGDWMYRTIAGINSDEQQTGYKHIHIKPHIGGGLKHASASLNTNYGTVESAWKLENKTVSMNIKIPANTTATVFIPAEKNTEINENGKPLSAVPGLKIAGDDNGFTKIELGSGAYSFQFSLLQHH